MYKCGDTITYDLLKCKGMARRYGECKASQGVSTEATGVVAGIHENHGYAVKGRGYTDCRLIPFEAVL